MGYSMPQQKLWLYMVAINQGDARWIIWMIWPLRNCQSQIVKLYFSKYGEIGIPHS
jgi:hypothetical protein